jgi:hypothetical protein
MNIWDKFKAGVDNIKTGVNYIINAIPEIIKAISINDFLSKRADIKLNDQEYRNYLIERDGKTSFLFFLFFIFFIIFYLIGFNFLNPNNSIAYYFLMVILPAIVLMAFGIILKNDRTSKPFSSINLLYAAGLLTIFVIISYFYSYFSGLFSALLSNYIVNILLVLIVLFGLSIVFNALSEYLEKQTGILGFIIQVIFYIPCLISELANYLFLEAKNTPKPIFVLFLIEILLILAYIFIPRLVYRFMGKKSTTLQYEPLSLDTQKTIASGDRFVLNTNNNLGKNYRNSNYSISFWVYLNPKGPSNSAYVKKLNIFNYADGKPQITYVDNGKDIIDKYIIKFSNRSDNVKDGNSSYSIQLPHQKWNYFVFNYFDNKCDLFINAELLRTFEFNENNVPKNGDNADTITVGDNNGLSGAICNVNYYPDIMTKTNITMMYNLLFIKNPPI